MLAKINFRIQKRRITARGHRILMGILMREAGERHLTQRLPEHFAGGPKTRPGGSYRFAFRSQKWQKRKLREGKPNIPLVYSGKLRSLVLLGSKLVANSNRWRIHARWSPEQARQAHVRTGKRFFTKVLTSARAIASQLLRRKRVAEVEIIPTVERKQMREEQRRRYVQLVRSGLFSAWELKRI